MENTENTKVEKPTMIIEGKKFGILGMKGSTKDVWVKTHKSLQDRSLLPRAMDLGKAYDKLKAAYDKIK